MVKLPHTEEVPDELFYAARVSAFMGEDTMGRWRLSRFAVSDQAYQYKIAQLQLSHRQPKRRDMEIARAVPPGEYISLQRRMTDDEARSVFFEHLGESVEVVAERIGEPPEATLARYISDSARWTPVMSDTPAEILEHWHALNRARGKVVITGLGLGCLPHALLELTTVTRIDIFDIDQDVIDLTGPYLLMDERVNIWNASASDEHMVRHVAEQAGGWDYAWHDIWTHISARNLDDHTAEHGISYRMLFDLYAPHVRGEQAAWAFEQAQEMERIHDEDRARELELRRKLRSVPLDEAVEMMYDRILRSRIHHVLPEDKPVPPELVKMLDADGGLKQHIRGKLSDPKFWEEFSTDEVPRDDTPLGNPNAHLEAR
jgi:hypothetical protein